MVAFSKVISLWCELATLSYLDLLPNTCKNILFWVDILQGLTFKEFILLQGGGGKAGVREWAGQRRQSACEA